MVEKLFSYFQTPINKKKKRGQHRNSDEFFFLYDEKCSKIIDKIAKFLRKGEKTIIEQSIDQEMKGVNFPPLGLSPHKKHQI